MWPALHIRILPKGHFEKFGLGKIQLKDSLTIIIISVTIITEKDMANWLYVLWFHRIKGYDSLIILHINKYRYIPRLSLN